MERSVFRTVAALAAEVNDLDRFAARQDHVLDLVPLVPLFPAASHLTSAIGAAGRALSAAYMSSLMGGIFGAALLAVSIPILRPVMLYLGSPELLAFSVLGISMVALLSGNAPLRGIAAG
ncbi:MAG: tripartite tricarboxylate transporter permease, partial [Thermoleophilum sp.]|nr:tripartite tricarboxylate transporter permease [Thermoleophilum sp.]